MLLGKSFALIYTLLGLWETFAPHMKYKTFVNAPMAVDKMAWYYMEPMVRCEGICDLALGIAFYTMACAAKCDHKIAQCSRAAMTGMLGVKGVGMAMMAYMYPELRTMATIGLTIIHHIAVATQVLSMMGTAAIKTAKEKTSGEGAQKQQ